MNMQEALNILRPADRTLDGLKKVYRDAAMKWHPDKQGGNVEFMKLINAAYEFLSKNGWHDEEMRATAQAEDSILDSLKAKWQAVNTLPGLTGEAIGSWLWVTGDTRTHKDALKRNGFKFSAKKTAWYWHPEGYKKRSKKTFGLDDIRTMFGTDTLDAGYAIA